MRIKTALLLGSALLLSSCDESTAPNYGRLRIITETSGGDFDEDGFTFAVGENQFTVAPNGTFEVDGLPIGTFPVTISGVASNCDFDSGSSTHTVTIEPGRTTHAVFRAVCFVTGIEVTVVTTGLDQAFDAFRAQVGGRQLQLLGNGTTALTRMDAGVYDVGFSGVGANCNILGGPRRTVEVIARRVTTLSLSVVCVAATGVVSVTVGTSGNDQDLNGYVIRVGALSGYAVARNATLHIEAVPAGTMTVQLDDVAPNCAAAGGHAKQITVVVGGFTRDTVRLQFDVACQRAERIAFVQGNQLGHIAVNGLSAFMLGHGQSPEWSPTGDVMAVESMSCVGGYSYPPTPPSPVCNRTGLAIVRYDGALLTMLSNNPNDRRPAWSPDGTVIAFDRDQRLRVVRVSDVRETAIVAPVLSATHPTWSPDGLQIAFTCEVEAANVDICAINRDGTGFRRLTTSPILETDPDWSPDGTRIAFTTYRTGREEIAIMTEAGQAVSHVISGNSPDWSPDGTRLVFVITGLGLATIYSDGSAFQLLSRQGEYAPSWRK